jgi:hypothetical protein
MAVVIWTVLGLVLLGLIAAVIARLEPAALGRDSTRLLAVGAALATYFGLFSFTHHLPALAQPVRLRPITWLVPLAAGAALLYYAWRVLQNWSSELHGLMRGLLKLLLVVVLAVLARLCFTL